MEKIICSNCKAEIELKEGVNFCKNCGAKLQKPVNNATAPANNAFKRLNISVEEAYEKLRRSTNIGSSFSIVDGRIVRAKDFTEAVLVGQKFFYRAGNYSSATVIFDDFEGYTRMQIIISGSGGGILDIDYGAGSSFYNQILGIFATDM